MMSHNIVGTTQTDAQLIRKLQQRIIELEKELVITEEIMNNYHRVLKAVPECPVHGECVPYAVEWIEKAKTKLE